MSDSSDDYFEENYSPNVPKKKKAGKKTVEETYQKKTQLEHILLRPDTYIGSIEELTQPMSVLNSVTNRLEKKEITYVPGLYKIFDEILVNASDNKQRDEKMDKLEVTIDQGTNTISVKNNGKGIPIEMHKKEKIWVPEVSFFLFLSIPILFLSIPILFLSIPILYIPRRTNPPPHHVTPCPPR